LDLDVMIDRLGAMRELDQRPTADQDRRVLTSLAELRKLAAATFPLYGNDRVHTLE